MDLDNITEAKEYSDLVKQVDKYLILLEDYNISEFRFKLKRKATNETGRKKQEN